MKIFEKNPKRFMGPAEVLIPGLKEVTLTSVSKSENEYVFSVGNNVKGVLIYDPFKLGIFFSLLNVLTEPQISTSMKFSFLLLMAEVCFTLSTFEQRIQILSLLK
jgi:hypothetical protein